MQNELIQQAAKLFPTYEHWKSFLELSGYKDEIGQYWLQEATNKIRKHFIETLSAEWSCEPFWVSNVDTRWFLREFGPDSLEICYVDSYRLDLRLNNDVNRYDQETIKRLLKTDPEYGLIYSSFDRIDLQFDYGSLLIEYRDYVLSENNNAFLEKVELAWYASHQTEEFVRQKIEKIQKFTSSPKITSLFRKLNQAALKNQNADKC